MRSNKSRFSAGGGRPGVDGQLPGEAEDGLQGRPGRQQGRLPPRLTHELQPDGQVRQWGEASTDNGKTWQPGFDFLYRRIDKFPDF